MNKITMSHAELVEAGKQIAASEMFGKINPASGYMIASLCYQEGISYLEFHEVYNWMHGAPSMKADAMLAKFVELGGKYQVVKRTQEKAEISVEYQGQKSSYAITWDEVKDEPFTQDRNGKTKSNYATPRKRMQSLWSRVVSDAVHTICPTACKGSYTPEEVETFVNDDQIVATPSPRAPEECISQHSEPNYAVCPEGFNELTGTLWQEMDTEILKDAFNSKDERITSEHKKVIQLVLEERAMV